MDLKCMLTISYVGEYCKKKTMNRNVISTDNQKS